MLERNEFPSFTLLWYLLFCGIYQLFHLCIFPIYLSSFVRCIYAVLPILSDMQHLLSHRTEFIYFFLQSAYVQFDLRQKSAIGHSEWQVIICVIKTKISQYDIVSYLFSMKNRKGLQQCYGGKCAHIFSPERQNESAL